MQVKCGNCRKTLEATKSQLAAINQAKKANRSVVLLSCQNCWLGFVYILDSKAGAKEEAELLRCPVSSCAGFVAEIKPEIKRGSKIVFCCGECGSVWKKLASLHSEIETIVKRYRYRRKCYRKSGEAWKPAPAVAEPEDYDELVEAEPPDNLGIVRD